MSDKELYEALDGLFALDCGFSDSGIHDETLRANVIKHLKSLDEKQFGLTMSRFVRESMLTENKLQQGYSIEDVALFINWLSDYMEIDL